ncbi:MAG TPA: energy transducer TonB [Terracidiphilus sp.]|nr:energy transducer TonB [Terracidiphilus sp.]
MFEDATFESTGRIRTRSRRWMAATFLLNGTILVGLILIPLIYPEALPRQALAFLLTAPAPPPTPPPPTKEPQRKFHGTPEMQSGEIVVPVRIPREPLIAHEPEESPVGPMIALDQNGVPGGSGADVFRSHRAPAVVHASQGPVRLSSTLVTGLLLYEPAPPYPAIAKAAGVEGTVVLQATISKTGTIEKLRVVSGPPMLQEAAIDTVREWRYRPYLLDGFPVELETTINVVFKMSR